MNDRRRTYCCHWSVIELRCKLDRRCGQDTPYSCPDYQDVLDAHEPPPDPLAPRDRPPEAATSTRPARPAPCPECGQPLAFRDGCAVCASGHSWKLRRSRRRCPGCGQQMMTFGLDDPHYTIQRLLFFFCACGHAERDSRMVVNPNGPGRYGGQRWSPRSGRLLVHR